MKLFWPTAPVEFNGRGISEAWGLEMRSLGFTLTSLEDADCAVFTSDSQIVPGLRGEIPTVAYIWGWPPGRWLGNSYYVGPDGQQVSHQAFTQARAEEMRACDVVLASSPCTQDQLAVLGVNSEVLLGGVDYEVLDRSPTNSIRKDQVLFVGRLASHKGVEDLIEAMAFLTPRIPLVVSGPGQIGPLARLAEEKAVPITFHQFTDSEKVRAMAESAVLVQPSHHEGLGLPALEALYVGTPVVVRDTPHNLWLLRAGAFYFQNTDELAALIRQVVDGAPGVSQATQWGRQHVRTNLTLASAGQGMANAVHEAVRRFCGRRMRESPGEAERIYDLDHRRNWFFRARNFDPEWERHWRAQHFIAELRRAGASRVLDAGCGAVYPTIFARAGFQVTALDHSTECLGQVRTVAETWSVLDSVETVHGTVEEIPWADEFDAVVLGEVLEHVHDPRRVVTGALAAVKPGGVVLASTPCGEHHHDPLHMGPDRGGWNDESMAALIEGLDVLFCDKIAEDGTEPSCYFVGLRRPDAGTTG